MEQIMLLFLPKSGRANVQPGPFATYCSDGSDWLLALN